MNFKQIKKINLKQKISSNSIIFLLVFFAVIYFLIYLASTDIKNLRAQIISEKIEIEKRINREQNMSNLAIKIKKIENELEKIDNVFIEKNKELDFIKTLEQIASYNNVTQNINLLPSTSVNPQIKKSILNIVAKGEYLNVVNYIRDIESLEYYININSANLSRLQEVKGREDNKNFVNANINADTFWK